MVEHQFPDDRRGDREPLEVRRIQPYQAVKTYRCPGCDHEIRVGEGHLVVVPKLDPDGRRHWHASCWERERRASQPR